MVYVTDADSNDTTVISGSSNAVVGSIHIGDNQTSAAVDSASNTIFITDALNQVAVVSGANNTVIRAIDVGYQPDSIALNPSTHSAYVSDLGENDVSVLLPPNSSTTAASCASPSTKVGSAVACSVTVSGASPTGMVNWTASAGGGFSPASCALTSGKCSVTYTPSVAGNLTLTALYSSDANNTASLAVAPLAVAANSSSGSSLTIIVVAAVIVVAAGLALVYAGMKRRPKSGF
jgi:DNA-binding beta-propeller fold protein YncE